MPNLRKAPGVVRHFMSPRIVTYTIFFLVACGQTNDTSQAGTADSKIDTLQHQTEDMSNYSPTFDKAHPKAKVLMNEDFYFSPIEETAPFGSDDGSDAYAGFKIWRPTHPKDNPKDFLVQHIAHWGYPPFDIYETDIKKIIPYLKQHDLGERFIRGIDAAIVATAFGQLYLEGTIDKDINDLAKTAINRQLLPNLLSLWGDTDKSERETKLKKLLAVLES